MKKIFEIGKANNTIPVYIINKKGERERIWQSDITDTLLNSIKDRSYHNGGAIYYFTYEEIKKISNLLEKSV